MNKWLNKLAVWVLGTLMVLLSPLYALCSAGMGGSVGSFVRCYVSHSPEYYFEVAVMAYILGVGGLLVLGLQLLCAKLMGRLGCAAAVGMLRICSFVAMVLYVPGCMMSLGEVRPAERPYVPLMIVVGVSFALLPFLLCRIKKGAIIRWLERNNTVNNLSE